ncbi:MAG: hypothetical protein ACJAYU_001388 [Bradymonadia bacterium]|jgi:uncharacterized protein (TIGR00251 family)
MSQWLTQTDKGVRIALYASPRATRSRLAGEYGDRLKLHVAAPPVDGAANKEISRFLARLVGVAKSSVRVVSGVTGKRKIVEIDGLTLEAAAEVLHA